MEITLNDIIDLLKSQFDISINLNADTRLINDIGLDSLDLVQLVMAIEKKYSIMLQIIDVNSELLTINDVLNYTINAINIQ